MEFLIIDNNNFIAVYYFFWKILNNAQSITHSFFIYI